MIHQTNIVPMRPAAAEPELASTAQFVSLTHHPDWKGEGRATPGYDPKVTPWASKLPEGAYAPHPVVKNGTLNGLREAQGPTVIEYLVALENITVAAACRALKDALAVNLIKARGPTGPIEAIWWRNATINYADTIKQDGTFRPGGTASCLAPIGTAAWFIMPVSKVLKLWPPKPEWLTNPGEAAPAQTPTQPIAAGKPTPKPKYTPEQHAAVEAYCRKVLVEEKRYAKLETEIIPEFKDRIPRRATQAAWKDLPRNLRLTQGRHD